MMDDTENKIPEDYTDLPFDQFSLLDNIIPTEVCHYTRMDIALEKILLDRKIRLGSLAATNDPRESKQQYFWYDEWNNISGVVALMDKAEQKLLKEWKVFCASCHNKPSLALIDGKIEPNQSGLGHSRMWAQYAENHKGVCLLFDGKILDENIREEFKDENCAVRCGFVKYDYSRSTDWIQADDLEFKNYERTERIKQSLIKHYKENFLVKSTEWKSEHEFQ